MADPKYDQGVRRDKDLLPYAVELLPEDEFGDLQFDGELIFGNGEDGDVTITTDTSLTEDMYYSNLTVNTGATLNPNGFRVFVKNTLTLTGDIGVKDSVSSVTTGSLEGTVGVGASITDGLGGAGEPDGFVPGYTFTGSGAVNSSVGVAANDFYDLRDAINAYKQRGSSFIRVKGGAGGGTGADGVSGAGAAGSSPTNSTTIGAPGGKGSAGTGGTGGTGGRGGGVVMVSARVISGAGGIYSEGGAANDGTSGTDGTPAPDEPFPAHHSYVPGNAYTVHHATPPTHGTGHASETTPGNVNPITNHTTYHTETSPGNPFTTPGNQNAGEHVTLGGNTNPGTHNPGFHHPGAGFIPGYLNPGNTNPVNHAYVPGSHNDSHSGVNPPTTNTVGVPATGGGDTNDPVTNHHTTSHTTPNPDASGTAHNPDSSSHSPAGAYAGGAGGTGYAGQRGGRGGGGVLIVVTRKAGTPSYSLNTGVNGRLIALDTANI